MNILQKTLTKTFKSNIINFPSISIHLNQFSLSSLYSSWCTKPFSNDPQRQVLPSMEELQKTTTSADGIGKKKLSKPSEIPFQVKVANSVTFVGNLKMPIQFTTTVDGKSWAGDLAHTAATHLKENEYVYVAGHLSSDRVPINLTNDKAKLQVMVHDVYYVRRFSGVKSYRPWS
ncbi:Protein OSB4 chloroplastic [Bienertia sinuspersici]